MQIKDGGKVCVCLCVCVCVLRDQVILECNGCVKVCFQDNIFLRKWLIYLEVFGQGGE